MGYKTWINVAPDGTIVSTVWQHGRHPAPADHPVLCRDPEHEPELRKNAGLNLYHDGTSVRRRRAVRWHMNGTTAPVGETIRLELAGLPPEHRAPVRVRVGEQPYTLEHPYVIELGWENAARVGVELDEPTLVQTAPAHVQFVERRRKP